MVATYVSDNHRKWDENLAKLACATRTAYHETIKQNPYFVNFGRNMITDGQEFVRKKLLRSFEDKDQPSESFESRAKLVQGVFEDVRKRLDKASQITERRYNLRRRHEQFLPHQLVWRRNFALSDAKNYFAKKLAPRWVCPFLIESKVSPWTYSLVDEGGRDKGIWSVKDLKTASAGENSPE
ncbi:hypothetical protein JTB14_037708 [Gonioctena quinquepunctata]|nr:hypothetical protein JTB14_037708 [Gonioctena quinquepunctata]